MSQLRDQGQTATGLGEGILLTARNRAGGPGLGNLDGGIGGITFASPNVPGAAGNGFVVANLTAAGLSALSLADKNPGQLVYVTDTGVLVFWNGSAFVTIATSSGSGANILITSGSPNGVVTAGVVPCIALDFTTSPGSVIIWAKGSGAGTNTGWVH